MSGMPGRARVPGAPLGRSLCGNTSGQPTVDKPFPARGHLTSRSEAADIVSIHGVQHRIREVVGGWEEVTAGPHRFGGVEFCLGKRELGHIHGDSLVDIPFPKQIRDQMIAAGEAEPHLDSLQVGQLPLHLNSIYALIKSDTQCSPPGP